jgi:esterase/lipase
MWSKYVPHFVKDGWKCFLMNLRGHYKSRSVDLTKVTFSDYLEDIKEIISECGEPPIIIGFSLGGILSQKIAEFTELKGLILIDSSISLEVNKIAPYQDLVEDKFGDIIPCPLRDEISSIDETEEDIIFQKKYLPMESAKVIGIPHILDY